MWGDIKFALRQLQKSPGFAATVVLTMVLGIGANTAIFSVVNAVLRHPAGVDHPERVAVLHTRYSQFSLDIPDVSAPNYAVTASLKGLVETAAIERPAGFTIVHDGKAEHVSAAAVSTQWFRVYGAQPILGRTFTEEEDQPNAAPVVVLSYGLWQRVFGGRNDVAGQTLLLDEKPYRVIGVMRSDFGWPRRSEVWVPIALAPQEVSPYQAFNESYYVTARMRPGISIQKFNAVLSPKLWGNLWPSGRRYASNSGWAVYANPLTEFAAGPLRTPLYVLMAVVALVLLIASANVAGLFLARASARSREFAIRTALGASVSRILRQLLIETLLLAGIAALAGVAVGPIAGRLLLRMVPHNLAAGFAVRMDPAVLAFTMGAALFTSILAGLGPAFGMMRRRERLHLHEGGRSNTASIDKQRLRSVFVVGEVALAFLLLAGTGLFLVSLNKLEQVNPGFNPKGVLAGKVQFSGHDFQRSQPRQAVFVNSVISNLAAQPGVRAAAAVEPLPFDPNSNLSGSFDIEGRPKGPNDPGPHSHETWTTPGYLKVMEIPLLAGRWFTDEDRAGTQRVVVIDTRLAQKYWPNQSALGEHLDSGPGNTWATVIGVVPTIRSSSLEEDSTDGMRYYPFAQSAYQGADFLVRVDGDPNRMAAALQRAVAVADSSQAVSTITPVETLVSDSLAGRRLIVWMLAAFAGLALLLAIVGIYGLISYLTTQRTNEMGIRIALGAQRTDVVGLILQNALTRVVLGLSIGAGISVIASALLKKFFASFGSGMIPALIVAALSLLAIGLMGSLIPALRAARIDPIEALHNE